jgi:hypothetical protein
MNYGKHAYLVLAHNNFQILEKLIRLLDDPRNDIYIHINKKVRNFNPDTFLSIPKKSRLIFIERMNVDWGAYSQIKAELALIKAAAHTGYDYYHYISGVDLPLKSQDYIHDFFDKYQGREFVHFDRKENFVRYADRIRYYHFLQRRPATKIGRIVFKVFHGMMIGSQKLLGVNRLKKQKAEFWLGADWFSITDPLARYILTQEAFIDKTFRHTRIGDEIFIQTIVYNSEFRDKLYDKNFDNNYMACLRKIDWMRGKPYVWKSKNFDELMNSGFLFARKFDSGHDYDVVDQIYQYIMEVQVSGNTEKVIPV